MPAWKYDMGQAVLVGVVGESQTLESRCSEKNSYGAGTAVKPFLDFIKNVTNLN